MYNKITRALSPTNYPEGKTKDDYITTPPLRWPERGTFGAPASDFKAAICALFPDHKAEVERFVAAIDQLALFASWEEAPLDLVSENLELAHDLYWIALSACRVLPASHMTPQILPQQDVIMDLVIEGLKATRHPPQTPSLPSTKTLGQQIREDPQLMAVYEFGYKGANARALDAFAEHLRKKTARAQDDDLVRDQELGPITVANLHEFVARVAERCRAAILAPSKAN